MAELKTKENDASVIGFIQSVASPSKQEDSLKLLEIFTRLTGHEARMWGTSIIGFGKYHYKSERSSQEGDWPLVAFSPRKQNIALYLTYDANKYEPLLNKLGKHKTSVACLYINKLADVDLQILEQLIARAYADAKKQFGSV